MLQQLSRQPDFTETVLQQLEGGQSGKRGPGLLTPKLIDELRRRILGKRWQELDRFPGWTMRELNPTVLVVTHLAGKDSTLEGMSAVHPGAPSPAHGAGPKRNFLDLGPYPLDVEQTVSLDTPSTLPGFSVKENVTPLGVGIVRGDGPSPLAGAHAESQRLADVMNRLSVQALDDAKPFTVTLGNPVGGQTAHTPEELMAALTATGHSVLVHDARYFANFGHLHYKGMDVMMPFWIDTGIAVPKTGNFFRRPRPLLVPASHAEYEWQIRGPKINADISHYFGVDGKAEFRTMDTLDQAWVLRRFAHTYTGAQALEVTRLAGLFTLAYMHQHAKRPKLAFGGYYTLGVCQDPVAAIELHMTGRTTLFPDTAESALFDDPRDPEVNALIRATPKDRSDGAPQPERVFGSIPTEPGVGHPFAAVTVPGLAADLSATYAAWQGGRLTRVRSHGVYLARTVGVCTFGVAVLGWLGYRLARRRNG